MYLMENLNEYILRYQQYKEGNYEYETITSPYDVKRIVESGKKIVFVGSNLNSIALFITSGGILLIGLIVGILGSFKFFDWVLGIMAIPIIFCFFLGLWYQRTRFMVLGPEGIVYKLRTHGIRGYNWKEIKMDFYNFSYIKSEWGAPSFKSVKIHIFMPNGDLIKVEPEDYSCKEILGEKYSLNRSLFMLIFALYYDHGKNGTFEWQTRRTEEQKQKPHPVKSVISTDMFIIDTWRDQLKEELYNYKKKKYEFGKYWTSEEIQDAFLKKKIFVLRGSLPVAGLIFISIPLITLILLLVISPINETFSLIESLNLIIFAVVLWFSFISPVFLILRSFLVINSSGVYYRNFLGKNSFSWNVVSKIEGTAVEDYPVLLKKVASVKIYLLSGKKIKFTSKRYKNKEFSKKVYVEMFFNLFNVNFKLSRAGSSY